MRYALLIALALFAGCRDETPLAPPAPVALTEDAASHFCMMQISEHGGPKAQIHLKGLPDPLFFAQVRDGIAYLKQPERTAPVTAIYVSDMSSAPSWQAPGAENWMPADEAFFVVGSDVTGGMGAPEVVPFKSEQDARDFAARHGGEVMRLGAIPEDAVLGTVEIAIPQGGS